MKDKGEGGRIRGGRRKDNGRRTEDMMEGSRDLWKVYIKTLYILYIYSI